ncbi:MAG TPA: MlaD family protein [Verrucomicrobiae bacterium]
MPVQDLTPQLRTRLSRVERIVGVFVTVATLLLLAGFAYYIYHTGMRKGWWTFKARYYTEVDSGAGLAPGGEVRLLGFAVGRITKVTANPPFSPKAVHVAFYVLHPYEGYIWNDSRARVVAGDFLGGRLIEITPGGSSIERGETNLTLQASYKEVDGKWLVLDEQKGEYVPEEQTPGYWLLSTESPAAMERLEMIANRAEEALPGILDLTNRVNLVLSNIANVTAEAQTVLSAALPTMTNVQVITANLREPKGSLGEWALPTNLHTQLLQTLAAANITLTNASQMIANTDTNVLTLVTNLDQTLINLANITSNLNQQVQSNTNLVKGVSDLITNADDMIQGLKRHWFLRGAFKKKAEEEEKAREQQQRPQTRSTPRRTTPAPKAGKWR